MSLPSLEGRTLFITGASRGIGLAIALRAARDGARIVIAAKTDTPHPKLPGTIHTAAAAIEAAGGQALPVVCDIRDEAQIEAAIGIAVARFGGLDILVNNASAISLTGTEATEAKRFDLMHQVNARGSFLCAKHAIAHLRAGSNPHILTLSPPLDLRPEWFAPHLGYSMAKFAMSLVTLGLAAELRGEGIAANSLWPRTAIATAAVANVIGGEAMLRASRKPEIVADAAHAILTRDSKVCTGRFFIDDEVLAETGVADFDTYAVTPGVALAPDFFVDPV